MSTTTARKLTVAAAAAATLALSPTASADSHPVLENEHFQGSYTHIEQEIGGCLDVPFPIRHDGTFNTHVQFMMRGSNPYGYYSVRGNGLDTYTNADTQESMRGSWSLRRADHSITDNGDGTITIVGNLHSRTAYHSPSGALIGIDSGRATATWVVDTMGTPEGDDDVLVSESIGELTGASRLDGRDLCDLALEYLS